MEKNYFTALADVDVTQFIKPKNGLRYLSWANAWSLLKRHYPDAVSKVYKRDDGRIYFDDGRTAWVEVSATVCGIEQSVILPIMDNYNRSIPVDRITSFDANKAIQRALAKAIAMHGLGISLYSGEDLIDDEPKTDMPLKRTEKRFKALSEEHREDIMKLCKTKWGEEAGANFVLITGIRDFAKVPDEDFGKIRKMILNAKEEGENA